MMIIYELLCDIYYTCNVYIYVCDNMYAKSQQLYILLIVVEPANTSLDMWWMYTQDAHIFVCNLWMFVDIYVCVCEHMARACGHTCICACMH